MTQIYKSPFNKPAVLDAQFSEPMQMRRREHALQNQERTQSYANPSSVRTPTVQSPYTRHPSSAKHTQQPTQVTQMVENTDHNGNGDGDDHTISESKSADRRDSVSAFKQQVNEYQISLFAMFWLSLFCAIAMIA